MAEAFTFDWDVLPKVIAEVRRRTLYPYKPVGPETDAEMAENPTTVFGVAFQTGEPVGCVAVLDEFNHDCELRMRWLGVDNAVRGQGIGARLVQAPQLEPPVPVPVRGHWTRRRRRRPVRQIR